MIPFLFLCFWCSELLAIPSGFPSFGALRFSGFVVLRVGCWCVWIECGFWLAFLLRFAISFIWWLYGCIGVRWLLAPVFTVV